MTVHVQPASSGGGLAFVAGPRVLLVAGPVDAAFTESAWTAIQGDAGFQSLLDLLTAKGLAATPAFALVEWRQGSDARLIVRGDTELQVTDAAGTQPLSAAGVSTWVERTMPGVTGLAASVPSATRAGTASLPLDAGVAFAAGIELGVPTPAATPAKPPAAAAAAPEPVSFAKPAPAAKPVAAAAPARVEPAQAEPAPAEPAALVADEADPGVTIAGLPEPDAPAPAKPAGGSYDYLFGDTMHRSVADAAVHEPAEGPVEEPAAIAGDHDGHTVLTTDIAKLRGGRKQRVSASAPQPAPAKHVLVVSTTGAREALNQPILIGRSPSVSKVSGGQIPKLITITGSDQDISRNHVQFAVEGGTVVVTDLHSKNGTAIVLPGKDPQKLRAGEPTAVIVGTVVDLGGGITLTVDEDA